MAVSGGATVAYCYRPVNDTIVQVSRTTRLRSECATVADWFLGSGTTIIACENLSRRCRAVEVSPAYVAVALQRWADHTQRTPVLLEA